jgi:putative ABC transport system permease protein
MMVRASLALAMRQLLHRGRQSVGALAGVCVAIVLMFMQLGFSNALYNSALNVYRVLDGEIVLTSPAYSSLVFSPPWFPHSALTAAGAVEGVEETRPLYAFSGMLLSEAGGAIGGWILGVDLDRPALRLPGLSTEWETLRIPNTALLDRKSRYEFEPFNIALASGETPDLPVYLPGSPLAPVFSLRGSFELGPTFTLDGLIVTGKHNFSRMLNVPLDRVSIGVVKVEPGANPQRVAVDLREVLDGRARVFLSEELLDWERNFYTYRTPIGVIFNMGLLVGVVVGVVFISQVLHGIIDANLKEYAVLVAMGYPPKFFVFIVLEIAGAIALLTFLPSLAVAAGLYHGAAEATHLPLNFSASAIASIFTLVVIMGCIAALFAMRRVRLANPLDLFT